MTSNTKFLNNLIKSNEFPIIFIGSGITQRYFSNAPTWDNLLNKIWDEANISQSYWSRYNQLKDKYTKENLHSTSAIGNEINFYVYTHLADELEEKYNQAFFDETVKISTLTPKEAHDKNISPFKKRISTIFSELEIRPEFKAEIKAFFEMLKKARIIITTNYDDFIEKRLKDINLRIGNKGLFEPTNSLNELYKIHGSINNVNSIVITSHDYQQLERTSAIVNAKILSQLTQSPILFLGYSLTDENVQSLLKDLSSNMPFPIDEAAQRIGVVNYVKGKSEIDESIIETPYHVHYTQLSTDNFEEIYNSIKQVDQGISPLIISKYQDAFREIIDVKGKEGNLEKVLTSFVDLDKLPEALKSKHLVVALGDKRYLYKYPEYVDYIKDYFLSKEKMPIEIAIRFILKNAPNSTLPIAKYVTEIKDGKITLTESEKNKLNKRLNKFSSLSSLKTPDVSQKYLPEIEKLEFKNLSQDLNPKDDISLNLKKINYYVKHIQRFSKETSYNLIEYILNNMPKNFIKKTPCRKLFMAYSLCYESITKNV